MKSEILRPIVCFQTPSFLSCDTVGGQGMLAKGRFAKELLALKAFVQVLSKVNVIDPAANAKKENMQTRCR